MLKRFLNNLHPAINKDPQSLPVLKITSTSSKTIIIKNGTMSISDTGVYDLSAYTLDTLAKELNNLSGFTATAIANSQLSSLSLLDGTFYTPANLQGFSSVLWQFSKSIAEQLKRANNDTNDAILQINPSTAAQEWLDSLGNFYKVIRQPDEQDELYSIRMIDFSIGPRINNIALQQVLHNLGYEATVVDVSPYPSFSVNVILPTTAPKGYVYSIASLSNMVDTLKAAGVSATVILQGTFTDSVKATDSISQSTSPKAWTWDNFVWGQFNW